MRTRRITELDLKAFKDSLDPTKTYTPADLRVALMDRFGLMARSTLDHYIVYLQRPVQG